MEEHALLPPTAQALERRRMGSPPADRPPCRLACARAEITDDRTRRVPVQDERRCEVGMVCADVRQCRSVRNKRRNRRQPRIELHSHPPCRFTRGAHPRK